MSLPLHSIFILSLLTVCLGQAPAASASSVESWSQALQDAEPFEPPFVTFFFIDDKKLCFVASNHDIRRDSLNARTIGAAIRECEPQALMLEGLPNWIGAGDREDFVLEANDCERNPGSYRCGELYWAITEVKDAKVALLGAEPMPEEEMQFIFEQSNGAIGFEDFIGYEISRMIIQAKRQDGFRVQDVPGIVAGQLEYLQWTLSGLEQYDDTSYRRWLEDEVGLSYAELDNASFTPSIAEGSNLLQQMSHHSMLGRDHFALERIRELLTDYDSVFVMYGASHLATLRKALTEGSTRVANKKYD